MTKLLKEAFEKASQLSKVEQNAIAHWMIEELESDKKWDASFAESEELLSNLADQAIEAHKSGKTKNLDLKNL